MPADIERRTKMVHTTKKLLMLAIALGIIVSIVTAYGATYMVPEQYPTIQSALDIAPAFSKISVRDGTYYENLVWPERSFIVLEGRSGNPASCIIDGRMQTKPVVQLASRNIIFLTINSLTIREGSVDVLSLILNPFLHSGAGISATNYGFFAGSVSLTIIDCIIKENHGPALVLTSLFNRVNSLFMLNTLVTDNEYGDSLFGSLESAGTVTVVGNLRGFSNQLLHNDHIGVLAVSPSTNANFTFQDNDVVGNSLGTEQFGCGLCILGKYTINIRENNIMANDNIRSFGMVFGVPEILGVESSISGSVVKNNISEHQGAEFALGIFVQQSDTLLFDSNDIAENSGIDEVGIGIVIGQSEMLASGTTILTNNMIYQNSHGGVTIANDESGETFVINNTIVDNHSFGISAEDLNMTPPTIVNCIVGHWNLETPSDDLVDVTATYSDIQDGDPGERNFSEDPLFLDGKEGNYHIQSPDKGPGSPCIGGGDALAPYMPTGDYDFQVRHAPPDVGADEAEY